MTRWYPQFLALVAGLCLATSSASAIELLPDPGFEDPRPLLPEDPDNSDPWRRTFFTISPMATDATIDPLSGLQHASISKVNTADSVIDTTAFAGFGPATSISDFRGVSLGLSVNYKVVENTFLDAGGTIPGTWVRMYLAYYGASGFLSFGPFADVFVDGTNDDYVLLSTTTVVPNLAQPVTSISYNLGLLGQFGGTGSGTIYFDDASLYTIPEPNSVALFGLALVGMLGTTTRRGRT